MARSKRNVLVAIATVGALASALADRSPAAPSASPSRGFDHDDHAAKLVSAGTAEVACAGCHKLGRLSAAIPPDHSACFGSCHAAPAPRPRAPKPYPIADAQRRQCQSCHSDSSLDAAAKGSRIKLSFARPARAAEFAVAMSHESHDGVATCETCHRKATGHALCRRCHDAPAKPEMPKMQSCSSCHKTGEASVMAARRVGGVFGVRSAFVHSRHDRVAPGQACTSCHVAAATATASVATPKKAQCSGCHDGDKAFDMISTCVRCHADRSASLSIARAAVRARFDHESHRQAGTACADCHVDVPVGARKATSQIGHAQCGANNCHESAFATADSPVCTVCHVHAPPTRKSHVDPLALATSDFGSKFPHKTHLPMKGVADSCVACHRPGSGGADFRVADGHKLCASSGCHSDSDKQRALSKCDSCHQLGMLRAHARRRAAAKYSVRDKFAHAPHRSDASGRPIPCARCHVGTSAADSIAGIPPPKKSTCAPCHDGRVAFKLTGHGCKRCHTGAR